ncbi:hypothetical protein AB0M95_39410 [Sphaerisporangium sp. NPDC051017]|uniref:hypothetical protein n=1 Tax=Sphaerisporangium sp. NPDC051017 TaxID=3154636 RepID=UPI00343CE2F1
MDRDGHSSSRDEDPPKQVDPSGIQRNSESERPVGDVLSDGWTPGHEPDHAQSDDSPEPAPRDRERAEDREEAEDSEIPEVYEYLYRPEGREASHDDERAGGDAPPTDGENWDPDREGDRGYIDLGWTSESDAEEEKGGQNKRLVLAMVAVVVLAVAGGWIVSSSVGSKQEAACSPSSDCAPAGRQDPALTEGPTAAPSGGDPAPEPSAGPDETTAPPTGTPAPAPTASEAWKTHQPTSRPTPTRTRTQSPEPAPRPSGRPERHQNPRPEDNPKPSPTPPPTTEAPPPAPSPTQSRNGGLLDWLF